jgi:hypothetical protein
LVIDHVYGNGSEERRRLGPTGVYRMLLKTAEVLPGYRVLCYNCNSSMAYYGYCPHASAELRDTVAPAVVADFATGGAMTGGPDGEE